MKPLRCGGRLAVGLSADGDGESPAPGHRVAGDSGRGAAGESEPRPVTDDQAWRRVLVTLGLAATCTPVRRSDSTPTGTVTVTGCPTVGRARSQMKMMRSDWRFPGPGQNLDEFELAKLNGPGSHGTAAAVPPLPRCVKCKMKLELSHDSDHDVYIRLRVKSQ